jgi:hypothetical protein
MRGHARTAPLFPLGLFFRLEADSQRWSIWVAHADVIVAPVIEAGGFGIGVSGHALRDFQLTAVRWIGAINAVTFACWMQKDR